MPRRILHIISSLERRGTAKQLRLVAEGLARAGEDVHVCVLSGAAGAYEWCANLAEHGVDARVLAHRAQCDLSCLPALCGRMRELRPDAVHTWLPLCNLLGRIAARVTGVKQVVSSLRDQDTFASRWQWPAERWLARRTQAIVANSRGVREHAARHGIDPGKMCVIPNAVEPAAASRYTREEVFAQLELPSETRLLGTVGALTRSKNLKHLIWVIDIFKAIHESVQFVVLGDGPQRARLEKFARQIEVRHRIHFLGQRDDVLDLLPHLDVYVSGSQHEGCSNGLLEAMAASVPPIVTDIPSHRELISHGKNGLLVPVGSRAEVAKYVKKLLDDADWAAEIGAAARESVLTEHTVAKMGQQYRELYA